MKFCKAEWPHQSRDAQVGLREDEMLRRSADRAKKPTNFQARKPSSM